MEPRCQRCVTKPLLRNSGWTKPPYVCPVCGAAYDKDFKFVEENTFKWPSKKMDPSTSKWIAVG